MFAVIYLWEEKCEGRNVYPQEISEALSGDAVENETHRRKGDVINAALSFRVESHHEGDSSDAPVLPGKRKQCPVICDNF